MSALNEVGLIAGREVRKNLRSVKGLVMVVLSLLGAVGVSLLLVKAERANLEEITPEKMLALQELVLTKKYDDAAMGKTLAAAPPILLALLAITVWLGPLLITVLGFDGVPGELQFRSVRYWTVRARRSSYYAGKVLGLWGVAAATTLVMHALIWGVLLVQQGGIVGGGAPSDILGWGIRFYAVTLPISAAWCGLAVLVTSQFRSPIVALFVTCAVFFTLWLVGLVGEFGGLKPLTYLYPNTFEGWLLSPQPTRVALGVLICFAFAVGSSLAGGFLFARRDV